MEENRKALEGEDMTQQRQRVNPSAPRLLGKALGEE